MVKTKVVILSLAILFLAGCSGGNQGESPKNEAPQKQDSGYLQGMVDINKKAQSDIQNATNAENNRLESTLNDNETNMDLTKQYSQAIITTSLGKIQVKFYSTDAPATVNNFLKLASEKFYDGTKFHRVIKGFMIQGGDPNSKTTNTSSWGMGGPGYKFNDELKGTEKYPQGTLAMANSGPNTNGSQFFIVTASPAASLPPSYTVFGAVVSGMDTALKIENVKTVSPGQVDRPVEDVVIQSVELVK